LSEIRANTISDAAGTGPITLTKQSAAKVWVNFDGTGTIAVRDSMNVSSLTDIGTGLYILNYSSNMANTNYSTNSYAHKTSGTDAFYRIIATGYRGPQTSDLGIHTGTAHVDDTVDAPVVTAQCYGDLS
jgi:hypothetical protein